VKKETTAMKIKLFYVVTALVIFSLPTSVTAQEREKDALYQVSTFGAFQEGLYEGIISLNSLRRSGNFGIGTYDGLDGEMVELDGTFYQIKAGGKVECPADSIRTPFAMVTSYNSDIQTTIVRPADMKELLAHIDSLLPTKNIMYAIRIDGAFGYMKTRSVPKQTKPYPRLADVIKNQSIFEFKNVEGTIVGYWLPEYMQRICSQGYHLHFLSADRKSGGHMLDCMIISGTISLDYIDTFILELPAQNEFYRMDLSGDRTNELRKIMR
jgi:acetolactate decarboxylase